MSIYAHISYFSHFTKERRIYEYVCVDIFYIKLYIFTYVYMHLYIFLCEKFFPEYYNWVDFLCLTWFVSGQGSQLVLQSSTLHSIYRSITSGNLKAWKNAYAIIEALVLPVSFVFWKAPNNFGFKMQPLSSVRCNVLIEASSRAKQSRTLKLLRMILICIFYL